MRQPAALALLAVLASPALAADAAHVDCTIESGPDDLVAQDGDLVVPAGARVAEAVALRGNVIVERGARVRKVVAAGGSVTVKAGAVVEQDAVAIGGDLRVERDGRIDGDALSLGGLVKLEPGSTVRGDVTSVAFQLGGSSLAQAILDGLRAQGPCRVVEKR